MSQDAIQEFKVYRDQFDAQYGYAMNAVVTVATKAGDEHTRSELEGALEGLL